MLHARPAARAGRDDQPGGPAGKAYPFLRMRMMARIRRPLAYSFLRPRPQKRVRMHTIGDGRSRICPPPSRRRYPPRTRFCDPGKAASSKAYPFLRHSTQKWVRFDMQPTPQKRVRFLQRQRPHLRRNGYAGCKCPYAKPLGNKPFFPQKRVRHAARRPLGTSHRLRTRALSAMKVAIRRAPCPRGRANNLHNRPAESGTAQISPNS